ncbi:3-deoxy-manno-octulosonate cytidylyltransferase [Deltaproteobacteria bacterium TL4]
MQQTTAPLNVIAVIPARYQSSRFPGKPLVLIAGKPMIQHVYERVHKVASVDRVVIATDDDRIYRVVQSFGGEVVMTRSDHATGTDRVLEAIANLSCEWVLNVQGDEPLINPDDLETLIQSTMAHGNAKVATLTIPILEEQHFLDPNIVKVVFNQQKEALYFSRSPLPYSRGFQTTRWKHIGVYLYKKSFLLEFHRWNRSLLEQSEELEQLRILEHGETILCVKAQNEGVGVDCPKDLERAEAVFKKIQG